MELADVPRHRPLAFDKMESLVKAMQDPVTGVPIRTQKLFLTCIPSAFVGSDLVEWLVERFQYEDGTSVEAVSLGNLLCQYGYFFPVNDLKNLVLKDDSALYRFQSPYYWPWQAPRVAGSGSSAPTLGPDNIEYAIYLVKRTLRNKQRHGLEDYEQEALTNLKKNLAAKWDFINMQAEEQVRLAKDRKKGDKIISDSQERAYWRVARPPPGVSSALEPCPVPVRSRHPKAKKRTIQRLQREIEHLKASLDRTRVKTSVALDALIAYSETYTAYDPWLSPPQPSNPWISDDSIYWQINSPLVEIPSEKRVQRWALSIEELVSDPRGLQEFTSFLRKEYSHENIRFWLAVMDLRRSSTKQIPKKLDEIVREFLKPGAPCEINIDGATAERVAEGIRSGSRFALDDAADHVYGLLLKKDCYPRFIRSDHFQRLLTEGRNVHQKKAKFFNFGGQVKKKPVSTSSSGSAGLTRRRGSDRSLSGSAHELAVCAVQPPRPTEPPPHSHSQSNLCDIIRDPMDDDTSDVLPWETSSRESHSTRRRQDSTADSGSSSSDVSAAMGSERMRRLPQQSTLDGGLRGAPPPLRRLSAVEPRHLAPLSSPPHSPRQKRIVPTPQIQTTTHHPTPTISVSSAPDDSGDSPPRSPDERRSVIQSEEPSSVFASVDATPTEPSISLPERVLLESSADIGLKPSTDLLVSITEACSIEEAPLVSIEDTEEVKSGTEEIILLQEQLSTEPSIVKDICTQLDETVSTQLSHESSDKEILALADVSGKDIPEVIESHDTKIIEHVTEKYPRTGIVRQKSLSEVSSPPTSISDKDISSRSVGTARITIAPLATCEDIIEDDNMDKVPSIPHNVSVDRRPEAVAKKIAHGDVLSPDTGVVTHGRKTSISERKQRNDICPWEDENSCDSDAPFVKTYATLGYL